MSNQQTGLFESSVKDEVLESEIRQSVKKDPAIAARLDNSVAIVTTPLIEAYTHTRKNSVVSSTTVLEPKDLSFQNCSNGVVSPPTAKAEFELLKRRIEELELGKAARTDLAAERFRQIKQLVDLNPRVTLTMVQAETGLNAANYVRDLMRRSAKYFGWVFFPGTKGMESFIQARRSDNKVMTAYIEVFEMMLAMNAGSTISTSSIRNRYDLDGQGLQSVVCKLLSHQHQIIPIHDARHVRVERLKRI